MNKKKDNRIRFLAATLAHAGRARFARVQSADQIDDIIKSARHIQRRWRGLLGRRRFKARKEAHRRRDLERFAAMREEEERKIEEEKKRLRIQEEERKKREAQHAAELAARKAEIAKAEAERLKELEKHKAAMEKMREAEREERVKREKEIAKA